MIAGLNGATVGNVAWKTFTGQSAVKTGVSQPAIKARFDEVDTSNIPNDSNDMSDADRMEREEQQANKHLKSFFAAATVFESTVRMLGQLGSFWGLIQGIIGNTPTGWVAVAAGAGSVITVLDNSFQVKTAAVNRNTPAAIDGTLSMVSGMGVMLTAFGLGRIPAVVAAGALAGKMVYGMYRSVQDEKEKEQLKKADEERKMAQKEERARQSAAQPPVSAVEQLRSVVPSNLLRPTFTTGRP